MYHKMAKQGVCKACQMARDLKHRDHWTADIVPGLFHVRALQHTLSQSVRLHQRG